MHRDVVFVLENLYFQHVHDKPQLAGLVTMDRRPNAIAFPFQLKQPMIPKIPCFQRRRRLLVPSCLCSLLSADSPRGP
jgi:hypothetical protein